MFFMQGKARQRQDIIPRWMHRQGIHGLNLRRISTGTGINIGLEAGVIQSSHSFGSINARHNASQTIFDFWKTRTQVNIQKLSADSAKADLMNTEEQVILNVKQAYYTVLNAKRNLVVAGETVKPVPAAPGAGQGLLRGRDQAEV